MAALAEIANEQLGYVRNLPYPAALNIVQDVWRKVRDSRRWSFLRGDSNLVIPASLTTGTVTVNQFSATVTGDATADAAWAALGAPPITQRQFRLAAGTPIYNIIAYSSPTLTLDRIFTESSAVGSAYEMYQCYFQAPVLDFKAWHSMANPVLAWRLRKRNLYRTRQEIDRRDPQRTFVGSIPVWLAAYGRNSAGYLLYEFWPHLTTAQTAVCAYQKLGSDLTTTEDLPAAITKECVSMGARAMAYEWAASNALSADPPRSEAAAVFIRLKASAEKEYEDLLKTCRLNDEMAFPQQFSDLEDDYGLSGPIDASFLQDHDVWGMG